MSSKPTHESRIAVTETRLDSHDKIIETMLLDQRAATEKLDSHIQASQARDERIQENLAGVTLAVTELTGVVGEATNAIRELTPVVQANNKSLIQWDTVKRTLIKVCVVGSVLIGAGWAVFEFYFDHKPTFETQKNK